jgi:hypothetical protein
MNAIAISMPSSVLVALAGYSVIKALLTAIPQFLSPFIAEVLRCILHPSNFAKTLKRDLRDVGVTSEEIRVLLPERLELRVIIPEILRQFDSVVVLGKDSVKAYFSLLNATVKAITRDQVAIEAPQLLEFFVASLGLRERGILSNVSVLDLDIIPVASGFADAGAYYSLKNLWTIIQSGVEINSVEEEIAQCFLVLALKLNDAMFRPFFFRLMEWATREDAKSISMCCIVY